MTSVPLRRGAVAVAIMTATLTARGATAQSADGGLQPRDIAARAQASLLVVRAIGARGDTVGEGTGFVVARGGTFVTNYHLVEPATRIEVEPLEGGVTREVLLVAADPLRDLAILRAPSIRTGMLRLGEDSTAVIGDRVYVMGNPMGLSGTFTDGLMSARRPINGTAMLQISAPISPGSSGGPVMNERGEVIGVATMMVVGGQNLNMAVPTRYIRPLLATTAQPRPFAAENLPRREAATQLAAAAPERQEATLPPDVMAQIAGADSVMRLNGLRLTGPVRAGVAAQGQRRVVELILQPGRYFVIARCDRDCSNLDLGLMDARGDLVGSDREADDIPAVAFRVASAGTYRAVVGMEQCSVAPCAYGLAVFRLEQSPAKEAIGR